jgi:hypothetical protein
MDDTAGLDPELIRFLREELGVEAPTGGGWQVTGPVWLWRPKTDDGTPKSTTVAWHFLTIAGDVAQALRAAAPGRTAAWGSVHVDVTIGATRWRTSAFPSKEHGGYVLPIKAAVRKAERIAEGDVVTVQISL